MIYKYHLLGLAKYHLLVHATHLDNPAYMVSKACSELVKCGCKGTGGYVVVGLGVIRVRRFIGNAQICAAAHARYNGFFYVQGVFFISTLHFYGFLHKSIYE